MTELRPLTWGGYPGLSEWVHCDCYGPYKREEGRSESERLEDVKPLAVKVEDGALSQGRQVVSRS